MTASRGKSDTIWKLLSSYNIVTAISSSSLAEIYSKEQILQLLGVFKELDKNNDNLLSKSEVLKFMRILGVQSPNKNFFDALYPKSETSKPVSFQSLLTALAHEMAHLRKFYNDLDYAFETVIKHEGKSYVLVTDLETVLTSNQGISPHDNANTPFALSEKESQSFAKALFNKLPESAFIQGSSGEELVELESLKKEILFEM